MQVQPSFWRGQRLDTARYMLVPRTLTFIRRADRILLLRTAHGAWSGKYNGVGGHVERGEDPHSAALREVREETGLALHDLRLCGVIAIDADPQAGIGLFVFVGESAGGEPVAGPEGGLSWFALGQIDRAPVVEDLPLLLPRALAAYAHGTPFSASYRQGPDGRLEVTIGR